MSIAGGALPHLYDNRNPYISLYLAGCLFLIIVCVVTRITTGLRSNLNSSFVSVPKEVGVIPYSIPWLGSALSFGIRFQDFLADCQYASGLASTRPFADVVIGNAPKILSLQWSWVAQSTTS